RGADVHWIFKRQRLMHVLIRRAKPHSLAGCFRFSNRVAVDSLRPRSKAFASVHSGHAAVHDANDAAFVGSLYYSRTHVCRAVDWFCHHLVRGGALYARSAAHAEEITPHTAA